MDTVNLSLAEVAELSHRVLSAGGISADQADAIVRNTVAAEGDRCHSHGIYRILGYVRSVRVGKANPGAVPEVFDIAPSLVRVDAGQGFAPLAFERGLPLLVEKAKRQGIAAMAINRVYHLSALWVEVEEIAKAGLVALAFTPSHSWVTPAGGTRPVFGTNPIAFGWPRPGGEPFVFDFATSAVARGEIELHHRAGKPIPEGWGIDSEGRPTTSAAEVLKGAMLTFGGHKGSALAAMVELVAGPLIGDLTSAESMAFDDGAKVGPYHGELIIAIDPASFLGAAVSEHFGRAEAMFAEITDQGARLPSQRRYKARKETAVTGADIPRTLYDELVAAAGEAATA